MDRRKFLAATAAFPLAMGCGSSSAGSAAATSGGSRKTQPDKPVDAAIVMNWFPEPEHGGFYLAENEGLFKTRNVNGEVKSGGPGIDVFTLVATGKVKFGIAGADGILLARNDGLPVVGLMAPFQINPQIIMVHADAGVSTFGEIAQKKLRVAISAGVPFAVYLVKKYGWQEEQLLRYNGQLAEWLLDHQRATQGYITSEPFYAKKEGANPRSLLIAEAAGFNPYANLLFTTEETIQKEPGLVHAVTAACMEGWRRYMASPDKTHAFLTTKAPDLSAEGMKFGYDAMKDLVPSGDAKNQGIGVMTKARWDEVYKQLKELGLVKASLDPNAAWTDAFFKPYLAR